MNKGMLFVVAVVVGLASQKVFKILTEDKRTDREKIHDIHEKAKKRRGE